MLSVLAKVVLGSTFLASTVVAGGCQSSGGSTAATQPAGEHAVTCEKCKTTWTKTAVRGGNPRGPQHIVGYRSVANHECPECRTVATEMLKQGKSLVPGKTVHSCKLCGGEVKACHAD